MPDFVPILEIVWAIALAIAGAVIPITFVRSPRIVHRCLL